ncbi:MAG TPA: ParB/RepB/Spo0J family partition protein [Thermoanaerobaculia bacterium]|nr:ParB/RepB/Spo0J family partition protein [Thermoanaerobaculia bacterium]
MSKKRGLPLQVKMRHDTHFVEELANRHEVAVGRMVPLATVEPDPNQPRTVMGDLEELVGSIREHGILEPILVRRLPAADGTDDPRGGEGLRIISGERRFRAAQQAGLYEIPVIEMEVTEQEALEIALIENLQRKDLTPFEEAEGYRALAERHGYTHEEIAAAVGKSRTVVTESLSLLQLPARVRDAVQALGISSKSLLLEVLKAGSEEEMIRLLEEVSSHGLNRDDLRRRLRHRDRAGSRGSRRKPYAFKFRAPDKSFTLNLTFRQAEVEREDLIRALQQILSDLQTEAAQG